MGYRACCPSSFSSFIVNLREVLLFFMLATPFQHKPVIYGSELNDLLFFNAISVHAVIALVALVSGVGALAVRKGSLVHLRFGRAFVISMYWTAVTGILLDVLRLAFYVEENHTKYLDYSMPSSYPARFAFLFAGLCVLYMIRQGGLRTILSSVGPVFGWGDRLASLALIVLGVGLSGLIYFRYNPWTGALWMIWTFLAILCFSVRMAEMGGWLGWRERNRALHRFHMIFLLVFCGWASLQGFGPAIALRLTGVDNSIPVYTGNQPGDYGPGFWWFLLAWAPVFLLGLYLLRRFSRPIRQS
jgi:hypothetical protein